jgi:Leu/Phe-tRNA-protein transferase
MTYHLKMFGAIEISFEEYEQLLLEARKKNCEF